MRYYKFGLKIEMLYVKILKIMQLNFLTLCCYIMLLLSCKEAEDFASISNLKTDSYSLYWDGKSSIMKVNLVYENSSDITEFTFGDPDFGGQLDIIKVLKNVKSNDGELVNIDLKTRKIRIYHSKNDKNKQKSLSYEIDGHIEDKETFVNQMFRPVIVQNSLYMTSYFFILNRTDVNKQNILIKWDFFPENLTYMNTINPNNKNPRETILLTKEELSKNLMTIIFGKYSIKNYPAVSNFRTKYQLLFDPNDSENDIAYITDPFFTSYFPSIQKYWNNDMGNDYTLNLIPFIRKTTDDKGYSGISLGNGFLMKYLDKLQVGGIHTIAHETSHYWIGNKINFLGDFYQFQWFTEGFNDYVTLSVLAKSTIYDTNEAFLNELNIQNLEKHYTNSYGEIPNDQIGALFWSSPDIRKVPYRRGLIFAFYLDNQIRKNSEDKYSLRSFLLDLKSKGKNITLEYFIEIGSKYLVKEKLIEDIDLYIIKGKFIDFSKISLMPYFICSIDAGVPKIRIKENISIKDIYKW